MIKIDLTGRKIGQVIVIKHAGFIQGKYQRHSTWLVICECGNEKIATGRYLTDSYNHKSCGCWSGAVDLIGKRFGRLTVIKMDGYKRGCVVWLCSCDCGKTHRVQSSLLNNGRVKSCGCLAVDNRTKHGKYKTIEYSLLCGARARAKSKGIECSITLDDIKIPSHCPVLGIELISTRGVITSPGSPTIDRVDNSLGYIPGNVAVISHRANTLKTNITLEVMEKIADYMRVGVTV